MDVGVIGSGVVGRALAKGFAGLGDRVKIGSRDPHKLDEWVVEVGHGVTPGTVGEVAEFGELVVLATAGSGTQSALELAGPQRLAGKVVIDATNPLVYGDGPPGLAVGHTDSAGEQVQRWLPESKVVKAFNIVGNAHMVNPEFADGPPTMLIAGNDDDAKRVVTGILDRFGWDTIDIGGIEGARVLEPLAILWVVCGIRQGSFDHAFKLLRK